MQDHPDAYSPFRGYIDPARRGAGLGRTVIGAAVVVLSFLAIPDVLAAAVLNKDLLAQFYDGRTATGVILQLSAFVIPLLTLVLVVRQLHGQSFWSLLGDRVRARDAFFSVSLIVTLLSFAEEFLPPWVLPEQLAAIRPFLEWAAALPFALVAILIQTSTEELFFRGYLQQQLGALWQRPLVWMGVPSLLFALVHYFNASSPAEGLLWVVFVGLLGLACADLTARHGTLGPAIGLHFTSNAFAFLGYGMLGGEGSGLSLFLYPYSDPSAADQGLASLLSPWTAISLAITALAVLVMWLAARIAIRR
jgi:membrane protease YdiL (CAAX protease family)